MLFRSRCTAARDGQVTWSRHELQYTGTGRDGLFMEKVVDRYALPPLRDVDLAAIQKYGVAVGFETNLGTLWGQAPDQNFQAKEYSGLGF